MLTARLLLDRLAGFNPVLTPAVSPSVASTSAGGQEQQGNVQQPTAIEDPFAIRAAGQRTLQFGNQEVQVSQPSETCQFLSLARVIWHSWPAIHVANNLG